MKFSIFLTKVIIALFGFGLQAQAQSEEEVQHNNTAEEVIETAQPPPETDTIQLTPYPISIQDRELLFGLIKADNVDGIKKYLGDHDSVDYPLIRFTDKDGNGAHGYTPLAAALHFCSKKTARTLVTLQYKYLWTTDLGPGYSNLEIAAANCPELVIEIINDKLLPLAVILKNFIPSDLFKVYRAVVIENNIDAKPKDLKKVTDWVVSHFESKASDKKLDASKLYHHYDPFLKAWINSPDDLPLLEPFLLETILKKSESLFVHSLANLLKAGKITEFKDILKKISMSTEAKTVSKIQTILLDSLNYLDPDQLDELQVSKAIDLVFLKDSLKKRDIQKGFEALQPAMEYSSNIIIENCTDLDLNYFPGNMQDMIGAYINPKSLFKIYSKYRPYFYGIWLKNNPRIDTIVRFWSDKLEDVEVVWTGTDESIDSKNPEISLSKSLIEAFKTDKIESLETIFANIKKNEIIPEDLRFFFRPYKLSPLKTAIMLEKPKIIEYLLEENYSLYATTKSQLSALEMAACYVPQTLIDTLLPYLTESCSTRLRALNHLIAMFTETKMQNCPTQAENAPKILSVLMDSEGIECVNTVSIDPVTESIRRNWPVQLAIGFHSTGHYNDLENYIFLAATRGNLELFEHFASLVDENSSSKALAKALATFVRGTNGELTPANVEFLESLLNDKRVLINATDKQTGSTALNIAIQRSFPWIVKRLLLQKDLIVNLGNKGTNIQPLQNALDSFTAELGTMYEPETDIINIFIKVSNFVFNEIFDIPLPKIALDYIKTLESIPMLKFSLADNYSFSEAEINSYVAFFERFIEICLLTIECTSSTSDFKNHFEYRKIIENLNGKPRIAIFQAVRDVLEKFESSFENPKLDSLISKALLHFNFGSSDIIKAGIHLFKLMFEEILRVYVINFYSLPEVSNGKVSASYGFLHNLLLSHPSIDTTVPNSFNKDSLFAVKKSLNVVRGDDEGVDEMSRTHVRIKSNNEIYESNQIPKKIAFGLFSTIFVGSASYAVYRWIM